MDTNYIFNISYVHRIFFGQIQILKNVHILFIAMEGVIITSSSVSISSVAQGIDALNCSPSQHAESRASTWSAA
jgi:hypothetical protein